MHAAVVSSLQACAHECLSSKKQVLLDARAFVASRGCAAFPWDLNSVVLLPVAFWPGSLAIESFGEIDWPVPPLRALTSSFNALTSAFRAVHPSALMWAHWKGNEERATPAPEHCVQPCLSP